MPNKFFIILIFLSLSRVQADGNKSPHHTGTISSFNVGFRYSSVLTNRGVILYRGFQVDPVVGAFFFDDRLEFLGDSIGYRDFVVSDRVRLRTRLVSITDKPLFPEYESIRKDDPKRSDTAEWSTQLEFFWPGYNAEYIFETDLSYSKDISAHNGNYFELQGKVKIFEFRVPKFETIIEPNLYASLGWGDAPHNQYFYGPSANSSGFNNLSYGIWFAFPEESDRFYPIVQIKRFQALGDYQTTEFSRGRNEGWLFSFIATVGIL